MTFASDAQRKWFFANNNGGESMPSFSSRDIAASDEAFAAYQADPQRRVERLQYAQAMYPDLSESDALRKLNDRNG